MALTPEQIGVLIYKNGKWGPGSSAGEVQVKAFLDTAIAVALAESGGDPSAISPSHDYGLWQINKPAHPDLFANNANWSDPAVNTEMARKVWSNAGGSWSPWSTYKSGAYKRYTGHGSPVYDAIYTAKKTGNSSFFDNALTGLELSNPMFAPLAIGKGLSNVTGIKELNPANAVSKVGSITAGALSSVFDFLKQSFLTIGAVLLAIVLFVSGIWFLVSHTEAGKKLRSSAEDAAKVAALA